MTGYSDNNIIATRRVRQQNIMYYKLQLEYNYTREQLYHANRVSNKLISQRRRCTRIGIRKIC